jgi:DNA polymerase-3 subunit alpha
LEAILKETYGIIVYQEQVMQIASVLANYTLGEADLLRRAMGKKKPEEMAQQNDRFLQGAKENQIPHKDALRMFELMAKFAEYGFNKSHSAAYALISYQTAFVKTHYPHAFMASLLNSERENTDKIFTYMHDCRAHNIQILPPDVNESDRKFTITTHTNPSDPSENRQIRFGLSAVKNVGEGAVDAILESRNKDGPFKNFVDFCTRVDLRRVNRRVIESFIMCGAFDFSGRTRSTLMENVDRCLELGQKTQDERQSGQANIFSVLDQKSGKDSSQRDILMGFDEWEPLHRLALEKKALGFFITGHPLHFFEDELKRFANANSKELMGLKDKQEVRIGGVVKSYKKKTNRRGRQFAFVDFEDLHGVVEVILFSKLFESAGDLLDSEEPLLIRGDLDLGEESAKIVANELIPMSEAGQRLATKVELRLFSENVSKDRLPELKELFRMHRGKCPTFIRLIQKTKTALENAEFPNENWEMVLSLSDQFTLDPSIEAVRAINQFFGAEVTHLL